MELTTLCYIERDGAYLMLHRTIKKNDVNKDKWIGVGGHFEYGESPEECLKREVMEETGLLLNEFRFRGIVTFVADSNMVEYMCLYTASAFDGEIGMCNEGVLEWVEKAKLNELNLWEGDRIFLKLMAEEHPFFSLKLVYKKERLTECCLDGKNLELIDLRTPDGKPTGVVRERSLVHEYGDLHGTVHVWIVRHNNNGKFDVLLQKRSKNKDSFPGCYDISSAGHISAGDDYLEAALRELWEELGIKASAEELEFIGMHTEKVEAEFYGKKFKNYEISSVYIYSKDIDINNLSLQEEEVEDVVWMDYDSCLEKIKSNEMQHCILIDEFLMLKNKMKTGIKLHNKLQ